MKLCRLWIKDTFVTELVTEIYNSIGPSGKLLWLRKTRKNNAAHTWQHRYMFDSWADPVVHLLLLRAVEFMEYQNFWRSIRIATSIHVWQLGRSSCSSPSTTSCWVYGIPKLLTQHTHSNIHACLTVGPIQLFISFHQQLHGESCCVYGIPSILMQHTQHSMYFNNWVDMVVHLLLPNQDLNTFIKEKGMFWNDRPIGWICTFDHLCTA